MRHFFVMQACSINPRRERAARAMTITHPKGSSSLGKILASITIHPFNSTPCSPSAWGPPASQAGRPPSPCLVNIIPSSRSGHDANANCHPVNSRTRVHPRSKGLQIRSAIAHRHLDVLDYRKFLLHFAENSVRTGRARPPPSKPPITNSPWRLVVGSAVLKRIGMQ